MRTTERTADPALPPALVAAGWVLERADGGVRGVNTAYDPAVQTPVFADVADMVASAASMEAARADGLLDLLGPEARRVQHPSDAAPLPEDDGAARAAPARHPDYPSAVLLPIARLDRLAGTQLRARRQHVRSDDPRYTRLDWSRVLAYQERNEAGEAPPPIDVVYDPAQDTYYPWDAFHRLAAADLCGYTAIWCNLRDGTLDDAIALAAQANASHGVERSDDDLATVVWTMYHRRRAQLRAEYGRDDLQPGHRELARLCRTNHRQVARILSRPDPTGASSGAVSQSGAVVTVRGGKPVTVDTRGIAAANARRARDDLATRAHAIGWELARGGDVVTFARGDEQRVLERDEAAGFLGCLEDCARLVGVGATTAVLAERIAHLRADGWQLAANGDQVRITHAGAAIAHSARPADLGPALDRAVAALREQARPVAGAAPAVASVTTPPRDGALADNPPPVGAPRLPAALAARGWELLPDAALDGRWTAFHRPTGHQVGAVGAAYVVDEVARADARLQPLAAAGWQVERRDHFYGARHARYGSYGPCDTLAELERALAPAQAMDAAAAPPAPVLPPQLAHALSRRPGAVIFGGVTRGGVDRFVVSLVAPEHGRWHGRAAVELDPQGIADLAATPALAPPDLWPDTTFGDDAERLTPAAIIIGAQRLPWQLPELEVLAVKRHTAQRVQLAAPGGATRVKDPGQVLCLPDRAALDAVIDVYTRLEAAYARVVGELRHLGPYAAALAARPGAFSADPVTSWVVTAPDPDRTFSESQDFGHISINARPLAVQLRRVVKHTPQTITLSGSYAAHQKLQDVFCCPDAAAWASVTAALDEVDAATDAWFALRARLGTYAEAQADGRYRALRPVTAGAIAETEAHARAALAGALQAGLGLASLDALRALAWAIAGDDPRVVAQIGQETRQQLVDRIARHAFATLWAHAPRRTALLREIGLPGVPDDLPAPPPADPAPAPLPLTLDEVRGGVDGVAAWLERCARERPSATAIEQRLGRLRIYADLLAGRASDAAPAEREDLRARVAAQQESVAALRALEGAWEGADSDLVGLMVYGAVDEEAFHEALASASTGALQYAAAVLRQIGHATRHAAIDQALRQRTAAA